MKTILLIILLLSSSIFLAWILKDKERSVEKDNEATNIVEHIRYQRQAREDKNGTIPMDALLKAKKHIEQMPSYTSRDAGLWEWEWLGPGNIGGRIRSILNDPDDPDIIWIGSVSGGLWKTTNGGSTWSHNNDFLPSLAISSMVYNSENKNIMYAGTGESYAGDGLPGAGIFKSTDGGNTWLQLPSTNNDNFKFVNRLCAHPDSGNIIYAVTNSDSLYKTTDGGTTWVALEGFQSRPLDVKLDPNNTNEIYVGCRNGLSISYDYGATWEWQATGVPGKLPLNTGRCEIGIALSAPNWIYISMNRNKGEIWLSTDNGNSWTRKNTGKEYLEKQGNYNNAIWVCPDDPEKIIVGGIDIYRSNNAGSYLKKISNWHYYHNGSIANSAHSDQHCIVPVSNYNTDSHAVVLFGNDGGIQKNTDVWSILARYKWVNLATGTLGITQFYGGAANNVGSLIVGGTQDNDQLRYKSGGSWSGPSNWYQAETGDGGFTAIDYTDSDIIYSEYVFLHIEKSTNGGDSYKDSFTGIGDEGTSLRALFVAPFVIDPNNHSILVAGGSRIWRTGDGADSWYRIRDTIGIKDVVGSDVYYYRCSAIDIAHDNSNLIWVGYENGEIAKTYNGGFTWERVDTNSVLLPSAYVTDICINPNNSNEVWITFGGFNNNRVWFTNDAGTTWHNRSGTPPNDLPALHINTIRVHPQNGSYVYIGTDLGVFATQDKGLNWSVTTHYPDNEGPVNTQVYELFWQGDEFLIAATHGRGMYRTEAPLFNVYVDKSVPNGGNGSQMMPFNKIADAENNRGPGSNMLIKTGNYNQTSPLLIQKEGLLITQDGSVTIK
jgi:photosystem II stability/assembly factor-like uncharacterized protein